MGPLHPRLVRGHAHLPRQPEDGIVLGAEPRAAAVHRRAVGQVLRPDPAPDAVARLEDDNRLLALSKPAGGGEPGVPGADDAHVRVDLLTGHGGRVIGTHPSGREDGL